MPCRHKFADNLYLENINFQPTVLIIGTFNPGWELLGNTAAWFYGRTRNNYFWDILPQLYGEQPLRQASAENWKRFCESHRIALTDLIACIDDADFENPAHASHLKSYRDDLITRHFRQFTFVDIVALLRQHLSINQVYLTRSTGDVFWRQCWQPINNYCNEQAIHCETLLTPSGGARFQLPKHNRITLREFIFNQWQAKWLYR